MFLLRRELQGFQSEEPRQSDEPPARPRAHTDAAVRGLAGSRTSGMTVALRGAMSPDGSAQGQSESEGMIAILYDAIAILMLCRP